MKKTLVSALTTALVVGAASTTFAAANPFEDVPADHWAYDAVAQLAADGVIEGYGDGTYRGDQEITRYEMAQMVARAMAKSGVSDADKAMIDKLAAEFADELNNLGVRVAALEKKVDNVKWTGKLRYRYIDRSVENSEKGNVKDKNGSIASGRTNQYLLRLEPKMTINEHWVGKARIDYGTDSRDFADAKNQTGDNMEVDRIYAEGTYGTTKIDLGKFPVKTSADYGLLFDGTMAGAGVTFGNEVKVGLEAGRVDLGKYGKNGFSDSSYRSGESSDAGKTGSVQGIEVYNNRDAKFTWGVGYQHVSNEKLFDDYTNPASIGSVGTEDADLLSVGLGYKFNDKLNFTAAYSKNMSVDNWASDADRKTAAGKLKRDLDRDDSALTQSYNFQLNYGGAKANKPGSWGLFAAYRHLSSFGTLRTTYEANLADYNDLRGWEVGGSWTVLKNVVLNATYFTGNRITTGDRATNVFTELNLLF